MHPLRILQAVIVCFPLLARAGSAAVQATEFRDPATGAACPWTAAGDSAPCLNAAIAAIAAQSGGGTVLLPAGTLGIGATLHVNHSGVQLRGAGDGNVVDLGAEDSGTTLRWIGRPNTTMLSVVTPVGAAQLSNVSVSGLVLDAGNLAGTCAEIRSVFGNRFQFNCRNPTAVGVRLGTVVARVTGSMQNNDFDLYVSVSPRSPAVLYDIDSDAAAHTPASNVSLNHFRLKGLACRGDGVRIGAADNNSFEVINIYRHEGGCAAGGHVIFGASEGGFNAYNNILDYVSAPGLIAQGTEVANNPSQGNVIRHLDRQNMVDPIVWGTGATLEITEADGLHDSLDTGGPVTFFDTLAAPAYRRLRSALSTLAVFSNSGRHLELCVYMGPYAGGCWAHGLNPDTGLYTVTPVAPLPTGSAINLGNGAPVTILGQLTLGVPLPVSQGGTGNAGSTWTTVDLSPQSSVGALEKASGTIRYHKIGSQVAFVATVSITKNGSGAGMVRFTLPNSLAARGGSSGGGMETRSTRAGLAWNVQDETGTVYITRYDGHYPGADGCVLRISGVFEAMN